LKKGPICCPETSRNTCQHILRKNPVLRRHQTAVTYDSIAPLPHV
jgi:hypothetical protein